MAKKKGSEAVNELEAVDLISLLSMPENADSYEIELSVPEQDIDLAALGAEQLKEEQLAKSKTVVPAISSPSHPSHSPLSSSLPISASPSPITPTKIVSQPRVVSSKPVNLLSPIQGFENDSFDQIRKDISLCQLYTRLRK